MSDSYQAVLLIAFGGPESPDEIRPFLSRVLKGIDVPQARIDEVVRHYEAVGGRSPLNEITFRQVDALQKAFDEHRLSLRVYVGTRNASPFFKETLQRMANDGIERAIGFILSSHQSEASWERYVKNVAEARQEVGANAPEIDYCSPWYDHPLLVRFWVEQIRARLLGIAADKRQMTPIVFTAHSLPVDMAAGSPYVEQLNTTARLISERLDHQRWSLAYQSRSGKPADPWLEPDILHVIRDLAADGTHELIVAPIGFVSDHVEVLYDLDIEAANLAAGLGIDLIRVSCPNDHPTFIRLMADVIEARMKQVEDRR
jgi:ferrochelatase